MVFICSPYRGDVVKNVAMAKEICRSVMKVGVVPFAPHLYFTGFLDDEIKEERAAGIAGGIEIMSACEEMWVFGDLTEGMRQELSYAEKKGIPIRLFTHGWRNQIKVVASQLLQQGKR